MEAWPLACHKRDTSKRSDLGVPYIVTDGMDATLNHADGQTYDSRSGYYRAVEAAGCKIVEPGMDRPTEPKPDDRALEADIKTAIEQVEAGYVH